MIGSSEFVTRAGWGARSPRNWQRLTPSYGTTIHWNGPRLGPYSPTSSAGKVRAIQRFHLDERGWSDIAYSYLVDRYGVIFEGRGLNRRTAANGTNRGNGSAYAICYLGGEGDGFTQEGSRAIHDLVTWLRRYGRAGGAVNGHGGWKATACPGPEILARIRTGIYATNSTAQQPEPDLEGDDVATIIRGKSTPEWWSTNGVVKWHLPNRETVNELVYIGALKGRNGKPEPHVLTQSVVDSIPVVAK